LLLYVYVYNKYISTNLKKTCTYVTTVEMNHLSGNDNALLVSSGVL